MCNLYSLSKHQKATIDMVGSMAPEVGNFPPPPGIFPDYAAPIITQGDAGLNLRMARWACLLRARP